MSNRISRVSVGIDVGETTHPIPVAPDSSTPFRILILGDFKGAGTERAPIAGRRPKPVDCDNLDEVLASLSPSVQLPQGTLRFRAVDDFHPDRIYRRSESLRELASLRSQPAPAPPPPPKLAPAPPPVPGRTLLESMLAQADEAPASRVVEQPDAMADFLKRAVAPHLAPREDPRQLEWSARVDAAIAGQLRAILHHPGFQSLEAAWRAVAMLIDRLQPDADLKIYIFDATLDEIAPTPVSPDQPSVVGQVSTCQPPAAGQVSPAQPAAAGQASACQPQPSSIQQCLGGSQTPWSLIVGNYAFSRSTEDTARLRTLAALAASLGAPFLAEAAPPSDPPSADWNELVHSAEARWIGLALPRFLLRLPYGKDTSPTEEIAFEEMPESVHAEYLWGNPAFFCATVLGLAFRADGWEMHPERHREIGNLPQHIYRQDGEPTAKPCAEVLLTDTDAEFILDNGFMPLASMKDRDSVLLVRLQSIADPPTRLPGRWSATQ